MNRILDRSEAERPFNRVRAGIVLMAVIAIIAIGSWLVRTYPNSGYEAGYQAVTAKGHERIRTEVDTAGGAVGPVCDGIHHEIEQSALEPRYDHDSFVKGCIDAVGHLYGSHRPTGLS